jgi:hypothetical protein
MNKRIFILDYSDSHSRPGSAEAQSRAQVPYPLSSHLPIGHPLARGRGQARGIQNRGQTRGRVSLSRGMSDSYTRNFSYAEHREGDETNQNFNYLKSCQKGLISPAHPAYNWVSSIFREKQVSPGELVELARSGENCFLASQHPIGIVLWDIAHELVPANGFRRGAEYALLWSPVNIVPNSLHSNLIHPDPEVHLQGNLLHYPQIYSRVNSRIQMSNSPDCFCISQNAQVTSPAVISAVCVKDGLISPQDYTFPMHSTYDKQFSLSRVYSNQNAGGYEKKYGVLCPQPHPLAIRWSHRISLPAYHGRALKPGDKWFLGLADPRYRQQICVWYQSEPCHWGADSHPFLAEPCEGSELSALSKSGYGCETIPRLHFGGLGAAHNFWISTSNVSDDLTAEEFPMLDQYSHESFLLTMRESFLAGKSRITCASCPPRFASHGRCNISRYNRREYIAHYREEHKPDLGFLSVETGTGLSQRTTEAFYLYLFSLAREAMTEDSDFGLRCFNSKRVIPYRRGAEACGSFKREPPPSPSCLDEKKGFPSETVAGSTPASSHLTLVREIPSSGSQVAALQAKQPTPLSKAAASGGSQTAPPSRSGSTPENMDVAQNSPDPSGLHSLTLGTEASGTEAASLPRRENSRSRKAPGEKP